MKQSRKCFLIDDDTEDQEIFQMALERIDPDIGFLAASNGAEGLRILKDDPSFMPDYVFLDVNMPKMNGMQCLPEIRKIDHLKDVQIIMYSTSSDPAVIQRSRQLGADDFLVKPDKLSILVNKLAEILEK